MALASPDARLEREQRFLLAARLLERVGAGKLGIAEFARLIDGPAGSAGPTTPPQGLTLLSVNYELGTLAWQTDGQRGGIE